MILGGPKTIREVSGDVRSSRVYDVDSRSWIDWSVADNDKKEKA